MFELGRSMRYELEKPISDVVSFLEWFDDRLFESFPESIIKTEIQHIDSRLEEKTCQIEIHQSKLFATLKQKHRYCFGLCQKHTQIVFQIEKNSTIIYVYEEISDGYGGKDYLWNHFTKKQTLNICCWMKKTLEEWKHYV